VVRPFMPARRDESYAPTSLEPHRLQGMESYKNALDRHRLEVFVYLETLSDEDLQRKACIPLFKQFPGTDEATMPTWVGAVFGVHWGDHAGQLAKIRKAVGLPEARQLALAT
jgi:hypothetical protein